ncbi:hypothetical protein [Paenibacillus sp. CMAA1364]
MSASHGVQEAKIAMMMSIAHSQESLARILASMADVPVQSEKVAAHLSENMVMMTKLQHAMCEMLSGISIHRKQYGTPTSPWLNADYIIDNVVARGEQEVY